MSLEGYSEIIEFFLHFFYLIHSNKAYLVIVVFQKIFEFFVLKTLLKMISLKKEIQNNTNKYIQIKTNKNTTLFEYNNDFECSNKNLLV